MLKILTKRITPTVESVLDDYQAGFRAGRSTAEQVTNLRILSVRRVQGKRLKSILEFVTTEKHLIGCGMTLYEQYWGNVELMRALWEHSSNLMRSQQTKWGLELNLARNSYVVLGWDKGVFCRQIFSMSFWRRLEAEKFKSWQVAFVFKDCWWITFDSLMTSH